MRTSRIFVFTLASFLTLALVAFSQLSTGTITGTGTDPSGAAIPNVQVSVVETETNYETRVTTNADGLYRVQSLQPGTYRVSFESAGFKRIVQSGLTLHVGDARKRYARIGLAHRLDSGIGPSFAARNRDLIDRYGDRWRHTV